MASQPEQPKKRGFVEAMTSGGSVRDVPSDARVDPKRIKADLGAQYELEKKSEKARVLEGKIGQQSNKLKLAESCLEFIRKEKAILASTATKEEIAAVIKLEADLENYMKLSAQNLSYFRNCKNKTPFLDICKKVNAYFGFNHETFAKL